MTYGAEDIQAQNQRVARLNYLYNKDLRFRKDHPWYGTYTGLYHLYRNHQFMTMELPEQ